MALKTLLLRKQIDNKKKELDALRSKDFTTREAELTQAIDEVETEEQRAEIESMVTEFDAEKAENEKAIADLEREIEGLESDLAAEEEAQNTEPPAEEKPAEERKEDVKMSIRKMEAATNSRERLAEIVTRDNVKDYLTEVRSAIKEKRALTNVGVTIPEVMLELVREQIAETSKLLPFVNRRAVSGIGRQTIVGAVPEAVWTEACANLNELTLAFNQVDVDGYKVAGYFAVCNATLDDSDVNLAAEIVRALGGAIALGLDKAILYGDGTKKPIGIATRLAQTSQPANWPANAPEWADLHTSNVLKLNINANYGAQFFKSLITALGTAEPVYNADGLFWAMNRKTHMAIMASALGFNAQGALVANTPEMPLIGGTIVEFPSSVIADYEIIGGYGGNYLLAERQGIEFASSDIPRFLQDQTVFKGTARYDGLPLSGKAFVQVNFNNTDPTSSKSFPEDYANAEMNDLVITAAASGSNAGKTVLTVSNTIAQSDPVLKYKLGVFDFNVGDTVTGFTALTSGTTEITAAAGKKITVVELDASNRVVSQGVVISVPKT